MPKTTIDNSFSTYTSMMRVTTKGRPYTKDLYDMFAAVLLQINLTDHRVMFRNYPYTFTTDEAAKVMSSLVFIHVHRHPDPADPTCQVATRTTTTFSMDYATAKNMIQHFLSARLIMSATDPTNWTVRDRGLWCPTLKGKYVMEEFTDYTQVEMTETLIAALNAPYISPGSSGSTGSRVITLDRLTDNDDQITFARPNMTAAFKAMTNSLPHDALLMDAIGRVEKKNLPKFKHTFVGSHCVEWLCDRLTVTSKEEAEMVAAEFVLFGWIAQVLDKSDKGLSTKDDPISFKTSRNTIYYVTERGCIIIGWKVPTAATTTAAPDEIGDSSGLSMESDTNSLNNKKATMRKVVINTGKPSSNKLAATEATIVVPQPAPQKYNNNNNATVNFYQLKPTDASTDMKRHDLATALIEQALSQSSSLDDSSTEGTVPNEQQQQQRRAPPPLPPLNVVRPISMSLTDSSMSHTSTNSTTPMPDNSQFTRLNQILETPLLRMYFREFLRTNYCVENINFWVDHHILLKNSQKNSMLDQISECYSIYETYLSPSATADVNIDHTSLQEIRKYVRSVFIIASQPPPSGIAYFTLASSNTTTCKNYNKSAKATTRLLLMPPQANNIKQRIVTIRGTQPDRCLAKLLKMFARVNDHVCRMMAEDSVPKFIKTTKYKELILQQQQKALDEEEDSDEEEDEDDDDDDYYDDSDEEGQVIRLTTALSDQRISIEIQRDYPLESMVSM